MEIAPYLSELDKNTGDVLQMLKDCSEEQFEKKEGSGWSILETLEHIVVTERLIYRLVTAPAKRFGDAPGLVGPEKLKHSMVDLRDRKIEAPDLLLPKGEIKSEAAFIEQFLKERGQLVQALEDGKIVFDNAIIKHPHIGDMTKSDWLHFLIYHTERHLLQIKDKLAKF